MARREATLPAQDPRSATPIDRQIGERVRERRLAVGMSQEELADAIGVTFQQIQKYEKGLNRVAASKLISIAEALGAEAAYFLPNAPLDSEPSREMSEEDVLRELTTIAQRMNPSGRKVLLELARTLATHNSLRQRK